MYNLKNVDRIISNILLILIENQTLLKAIKNPTRDALSKPDLTDDEIFQLIINENDDPEARIFFTPFDTSTTTDSRVELRIFISQFRPDNINLSNIRVSFQIICNNNLWRLDEGRIRPLVIIEELLSSLNGTEIGFIGDLIFNTPTRMQYYNTKYSGYELLADTKST